jgi:hypothetical protein
VNRGAVGFVEAGFKNEIDVALLRVLAKRSGHFAHSSSLSMTHGPAISNSG